MLIDADVAELYGVETKRINEAVRNNPQKFPYGYIFELEKYAMEALQDVQDSGEQQKNLLHRTGALRIAKGSSKDKVDRDYADLLRHPYCKCSPSGKTRSTKLGSCCLMFHAKNVTLREWWLQT